MHSFRMQFFSCLLTIYQISLQFNINSVLLNFQSCGILNYSAVSYGIMFSVLQASSFNLLRTGVFKVVLKL